MITHQQYENFIRAVTDEMQGDWVLVGGALMALLVPNSRTTVDIDLCPLDDLSNDRRLQLMKLAQASGMNLESINPSADYFLRQIPNWKSSLVPFIHGKKGTLFRPSLKLYLQMKIERLSESDVSDCLAFLEWHRINAIAYNSEEIRNVLNKKLSAEVSEKKQNALKKLISKF